MTARNGSRERAPIPSKVLREARASERRRNNLEVTFHGDDGERYRLKLTFDREIVARGETRVVTSRTLFLLDDDLDVRRSFTLSYER